ARTRSVSAEALSDESEPARHLRAAETQLADGFQALSCRNAGVEGGEMIELFELFGRGGQYPVCHRVARSHGIEALARREEWPSRVRLTLSLQPVAKMLERAHGKRS